MKDLDLSNNNVIDFMNNYFPTATNFTIFKNRKMARFDNNNLDSIATLYIGTNELSSFSNNFLRSLTTLSIEESPAESMKFVGNRVQALKVLNLTGNNISDFKGNTLSALEELYLGHGSIQ